MKFLEAGLLLREAISLSVRTRFERDRLVSSMVMKMISKDEMVTPARLVEIGKDIDWEECCLADRTLAAMLN